ncbi:cytoplasmic protein [Desulfococcaceae bacterium HSG8]|nr:cytoplasmic protein [Desulfococcaceae bacterium HSG8]
MLHKGKKSVASCQSSVVRCSGKLATDNGQLATDNTVIYLKERNFNMLKKELIFRNPLRLMGHDTEDILLPGGFGAVLARAGLGKTAILVQLALDSLLRSKNVLHISLADPVKKVCLWYEEVFRNIANQYDVRQIDQLWEAILPYRLIMTFNVDSFSVPKLEERLADLTEQDIFMPQMILIDGLPFDESVRGPLTDFKALAENHGLHVWFTVKTHRHETPGPDGMPTQLLNVKDLFEVVFQLRPEEKNIHIDALKGGAPNSDHSPLFLDPSTMLIRNA